MTEYKIIDLCAGIGGIRKGFELTNHFKTVYAADNDKNACLMYSTLFNEYPLKDITDNDVKEEIANTDFNVLCAGFPCQPFSIAGKKCGFNDKDNGQIFFHLCEIISRNRPYAVFLENTKNLTSINGGLTFKQILNVLTNQLDYTVIGVKNTNPLLYDKRDFILNTVNFGLPQKRERCYIIALNNEYFYKDCRFEYLPQTNNKIIFNNLESVLTDGDDLNLYLSQGYWDYLKNKKIRNKERNCNFAYDIVNEGKIPHFSNCLIKSVSGLEQNLIRDCADFAGLHVPPKRTPINADGIRFLSPNECARLQGFKDYAFLDKNGYDAFYFTWSLSTTAQYQLIGNSVSIPVIESLAHFLYKIMEQYK